MVTVRNYGYTEALANRYGIGHTLIGTHSGANKVRKVIGLVGRVGSLVRWARGRKIDVALSHGSRSLVLASRVLRIPSVTLYDYEFVQTAIFNRFSKRVMLPEWLPDDVIASMGLPAKRVRKYPGLKEEVYLGDFQPDTTLRQGLGIDADQILVVLRPPATVAHYHNPLSERILEKLTERISDNEAVTAVVAPRTAAQGEDMKRRFRRPERFCVLDRPVDGLNLIAMADLVVGGGGTMNREAALLGVPVYSVFLGRLGSIDRRLSEQGRLHMLRTVDDAATVRFEKRPPTDPAEQASHRRERSRMLVGFIAKEVLAVANGEG